MKFRGGMSEMIRQASRIQRKVEARKEELKRQTVEATGGNNRVKVVVNGAREVVSIEVDPELIKSEELSLVLDLIAATANAALGKSAQMLESEIDKITGGMRIPGLF
jgi:DNA-binding YbaB/EbfC family protein